VVAVGKDPEYPTVDQVVGSSLRRFRLQQGLSQDALARRMRRNGLPWSRSTVASLEAGGKTLDIGEMAALSFVLQRPLSTWFEGEGVIQVWPGFGMWLSSLRRVLSSEGGWSPGEPEEVWKLEGKKPEPPKTEQPPRSRLAQLAQKSIRLERYERIYPLTDSDLEAAKDAAKGEAERRAARKLGVEDPTEIALAAQSLWGQSLTDKRDEYVFLRKPSGALLSTVRALRGRATRELLEELEPVVRKADG
jgi:transcriptional regulator with XRE-family HTH domain